MQKHNFISIVNISIFAHESSNTAIFRSNSVMAKIIIIESSTEVCSVAIANNGKIIGFKEELKGQNHAKLLTVFIQELLHEFRIETSEIDAVAVSQGPGSYTGLRIGVSIAKGICYANKIPIIALSTLEAMTREVIRNQDIFFPASARKRLFCPMMDARRMEVYTQLFDNQGNAINEISAQVITNDSFSSELSEHSIVFFGNGAMKCKDTIEHESAFFTRDIHASAAQMCDLANEKYTKKIFEDVAYFEPFYLKDFIATVPKNNVLGK